VTRPKEPPASVDSTSQCNFIVQISEENFFRGKSKFSLGLLLILCCIFFTCCSLSSSKLAFWGDVLPDKLVCIFDDPLFPGEIGVSEKETGV
jgi:hypothetical protein